MKFIDEDGKNGVFFEFTIPKNLKKTDRIFFAYTYPYNLNDIEFSTKQIQDKCSAHKDKIHFSK